MSAFRALRQKGVGQMFDCHLAHYDHVQRKGLFASFAQKPRMFDLVHANLPRSKYAHMLPQRDGPRILAHQTLAANADRPRLFDLRQLLLW